MEKTCVLRSVKGIQQYVATHDVYDLQPGETAYVGIFRSEQVKDGPSGSHLRTIYLPTGSALRNIALTAADIANVRR